MLPKLTSTKSLILFACLAHLPIGFEYLIRMWRMGHYQFFPMVMIVIGWLWYQMSDRLKVKSQQPNTGLFNGALLVVLVTVLIATILNSSFLGAISMGMLFATALYGFYGWSGFIAGLPLVYLTLFIIPLPGRIDTKLIFNLQFLASQLASWILDTFGQTHFLEGVVLQTETRGFMTEEACSGIRSLFSSLAGIAVYGVTMGHGWPRHAFNLIQTVFWVIVGNAVRIAIVVVVSEHYNDAIATGRPHELLGLCTFLVIFLLAISTDRLFGSFAKRPEEFEGKSSVPADEAVDYSGQSQSFGWLAIPVCIAILLIGLRVSYVQTFNNQGISLYTYDRLPFPAKEALPPQLSGWQVVNFEHRNRGKENLQAEDSFIWTLEKDGLVALVSIDCPWEEWHNLDDCYTGLGWNTHIRHFFDGQDILEDGADLEEVNFSQIGMHKNSGETGVVIFSAVDANASLVSPQFSGGFFSIDAAVKQMVGNAAKSLGMGDDAKAGWQGYKLPLSTFQLLCTPETEITPRQLESLRQLFVEARRVLARSKRFSTSGS